MPSWLCCSSHSIATQFDTLHQFQIVFHILINNYACIRCLVPRQAPLSMRMAQVLGVAHLVGAPRAVQNNSNVKSEPKYLACKESPICDFYFWTLSCSSVTLLVSMVDWLLCFACLRVASCWVRSTLVYALDFARYVRCKGPAALSFPSSAAKKCRPDIIK